ncbi:glycosyltransferase family 4 protein [Methylococcus geothermalis]|nr:glycosyltransferase family 4 protein [Methylococcus geothermalis]
MDYYDFGLGGGLAEEGVDVVLHTSDETPIPKAAAFSVHPIFRGIYGPDQVWRRAVRFIWGSLMALGAAVVERRRVVHFHFFHVGILQAMQIMLARSLFRRVVVTAHDVESFVEGLETHGLSRRVYRWADGVIAHNRVSQNELVARLGVKPDKIAVIPHGHYLHMLQPLPPMGEARHRLGLPGSAKVLLFFGQIKQVKGLDVLIEAMPEVLRKHPDAVLVIAGRPWKTDFSAYARRIEELGIGDRCHRDIRYIPDAEVSFYYGACDLVVLPYRRIYQSGVVLMAMSYGKPVLVSDLPGMTEIVRDGENGLVFRREDPKDLARRLNAVLEEKALLQAVAEKGLAYVRAIHDWREIGRRTAAVYRALLNLPA